MRDNVMTLTQEGAREIEIAAEEHEGRLEISPLKLYEYAAAALPVVASAVGQIPSVVEDGVKPENPTLAELPTAVWPHDPLGRRRAQLADGADAVTIKGAAPGEDANTAALTFGKRISKDLYLTYERTLSGTLGALYIFYDLSRNLTLRGQAGSNSAVDLIYTMKYD